MFECTFLSKPKGHFIVFRQPDDLCCMSYFKAGELPIILFC